MRVMVRALVITAVAAVGVLWPAVGQAGTGVTLVVTKRVVGEAPYGTRFAIEVQCESSTGPSSQTVTFGATGGSGEVDVASSDAVCTITEQADGGAASVSYESADDSDPECSYTPTPDLIQVSFSGGVTCGAIVLNAFPPFSEPPPPPPPTPPPTSGPAPATQAAPAFTG